MVVPSQVRYLLRAKPPVNQPVTKIPARHDQANLEQSPDHFAAAAGPDLLGPEEEAEGTTRRIAQNFPESY